MTSPHLIHGSYGSDDQAAADRILEMCKGKPRKIMGPLDYSAGDKDYLERLKEASHEPRLKGRMNLAEKCAEYLRDNGPKTTAELSRAMDSNSASINRACLAIPNIRTSDTKDVNGKMAGVWSLGGGVK